MKIVYYSLTGNIKKFLKKTKSNEIIEIKENLIIDDKFILVTSTVGFGEIPSIVDVFLAKNHKNLVVVVGSGNRNWGVFFANAAKLISKKYNVINPLNFELQGTDEDVEKFKKIREEIYELYRT